MTHKTRDEEKLRYHQRIAEELRRDPERVMTTARANLARWRQTMGPQPYYERWEEILETMAPEEIVALLLSNTEEGRSLRQSAPFAGVLTQEERDRYFASGGEGARGSG